MRQIARKIVAVLVVVLGLRCVPEAPHTNPVDPYFQSGNSKKIFHGEVLHKSEPFSPLPGCRVLMLPEKQFEFTDSRGQFRFSLLQAGVHQFVLEKNGFSTDTILINPDTVRRSPVHFFLNGKPYVKQLRIYSEYIDQWWPDPVTLIHFELLAGDPDGGGDLKSLFLRVPELGLDTTFRATARPDSFTLRLTGEDFPENDPFRLIGQDAFVYLTDRSDERVKEGPFHLIRILENSPVPLEPVSLQEVSPRPLFRWEPYPASFAFTYEVAVFFIQAGIPILIFQDEGLPPTQLQYQYPDSLATGTYFWTVGVRDKLGNFSRSKEASFVVP